MIPRKGRSAGRMAMDDYADEWDRTNPTPDLVLEGLASDYQRYQYCRMKMDEYRQKWFAGQRAEIMAVLKSRDERFAHMDFEERKTTGSSRWSRTVESGDLAGLEQMYARWAGLYLAASETDASRRKRGLSI